MRCDVCGSSDSVFFVKPDGAGGELHVCRSCAVLKGYAQAGDGLGARLDSFLNEENTALGPCPHCGWTAERLATSAQLGCTHCIKVFKREIIALRKRAGASAMYDGKVARASPVIDADAGTRMDLSISLEKALREEDFEKAARIRDSLISSSKRPRA